MNAEPKPALKAKFHCGLLLKEPPGLLVSTRVTHTMELTFLQRGWLAIKTTFPDKGGESTTYDIVKKDYSTNHHEGDEIYCGEVADLLYEDLVTGWKRTDVAPVKKECTRLLRTGGHVSLTYERYEEGHRVLGAGHYLVRVEYNSPEWSLEHVEKFVRELFSFAEDVTTNPDFTDEAIARKVADNHRQSATI